MTYIAPPLLCMAPHHARATVERDVVPMVQQQIAEMTRRFKHLKFTPARLPTRLEPAPPVERSVDSELTCPDCSTRFQVDGIFGYCARLTPDQVRLLKRVFPKRHVHDHTEGIVSPQYVREIPEDAPLLGRRAPLSIEELEAAAGVLRLALEQLVLAR